jgi:hypothetical protein
MHARDPFGRRYNIEVDGVWYVGMYVQGKAKTRKTTHALLPLVPAPILSLCA